MIRLLKLSEKNDEELGSEEILYIHLGHYLSYGKVTYSTDIAVSNKPKYVLLVLGNVDDICYLCHVEDHIYRSEPVGEDVLNAVNGGFILYSPEKYKVEKHRTWLILDSMQKIPVDFIDRLISREPDKSVYEFIKNRANHKIL